MQLAVIDTTKGKVLGQAVSRDGEPASVSLRPNDCYGNQGVDLEAQVAWSGTARSGADYTLSRSGSY
jgi:hypothetical protein